MYKPQSILEPLDYKHEPLIRPERNLLRHRHVLHGLAIFVSESKLMSSCRMLELRLSCDTVLEMLQTLVTV